MQNHVSYLSKAYASQYNEILLEKPHIDGEIPSWLCGYFISNGPGQFEVGLTHFKHWFDGFAMLKKFEFNEGSVHFQNRFLQSTEYTQSTKISKLSDNEFGTYANASLLGRIKTSLQGLIRGSKHDNGVVNTSYLDNDFVAMTESKDLVTFNIKDLSTQGEFKFLDNIPCHVTTAHPHFDINSKEYINVAIELGKTSKYHIYKVEQGSRVRQHLQTYQSDSLFYMHSFSITAHYIILFKSPLVISKLKLMLGLPFNETLTYQKEHLSSFFIVIDRYTGQTFEIETEPFICLHSINAYEQGKEIVLDLVCHHSPNPYNYLYLENLCSNTPTFSFADVRRFVIQPALKKCEHYILSGIMHEFPRINYEICNSLPYQFAYTASMLTKNDPFFTSLHKLNVQTGTVQQWYKTNYFVGEPVFVPKDNSLREDEGILLSIALNSSTQLSSLLILDAQSMEQLAEVYLPIHLPFGLHGNFYRISK